MSSETPIDLGTLPTERLEAELCEWAAVLAAADCRFLEMIAEFDRRKAWASWGMASCAQWLSWRCALAPPAARERVRVANALTHLPLIRSSFTKGRLSYSKVRAITRVAQPETEADLCEIARFATASQLERIVRAWQKSIQANSADKAKLARRTQRLSYRYDDNGCLVGSFKLAPEDGAHFVAGIEALMEPPPTREQRQSVSAETQTPAHRRADALVAMVAMVAMAQATAGQPADERTMVVVEVSAEVLSDTDLEGKCELRNGPALPAETARRLACAALEMYRFVDEHGHAVAETRPTKSIPRHIRRALRNRDKGQCMFPGCASTHGVEAHHVVHRSQGGSHELDNLVTMCRHHHHLVHEGGFRVECTASDSGAPALQFSRPDGRPIPGNGELRSPMPGPDIRSRLGEHDRAFTPSTMLKGTGERMDLELTVWALANNTKRRMAAAGAADVSAETSLGVRRDS